MSKTHRAILFLICSLLFSYPLSAKVWINEIMQSNIDGVVDDLHEFPDSWLELYNDSDKAVNIQNWSLSVDADYSKAWKITTSASIPAKGYLLIYCDKEGSGLHAPFRIDSGKGESLYLFDSSGKMEDSVLNIPKQPAPNIARGRVQDAVEQWEYFVNATPKAKNQGVTSSVLLPDVQFSISGGVYKSTVKVSLSLPADIPPGVTTANIHYTTDCSEPTINSPVYKSEMSFYSTKVLKAKLIHPNYLSKRSKTHTYIISTMTHALPVVAISTQDSYLNDQEFGIYVKGNGKYGKDINDGNGLCNWNNNWRRPMNFEYFPKASDMASLNQLGEFRLAGGWSRANKQKTFVLYANKRFGENKRFDYDLFPAKPGMEIKSFMLRNSGNDFWYTHFRDAAIQLFMGGKVDIDYQEYQPTIFYLNGKYWGVQNLRERSNEDFVLSNYQTEDVDVIENWWGDVKTGDDVAFNQLVDELRKSESERDIEWIKSQVDLNEFINYMILQIYVSNTDFPGNNMVMWRPKREGGKWRFILKDLDQGLGIWGSNKYNHNALAYNTQEYDRPRRLFMALLTQESFKKEFYSRFAIYMGDILSKQSTDQVIDSLQQKIEPAYEEHILRWRGEVWWRDMNSWKSEVNTIKEWCRLRNDWMYGCLRTHFNLGTVMKMTIKTESGTQEKPTIYVNGVKLQKSELNGSYFRNETLKLEYEPKGSQSAWMWEVASTVNGKKTTEIHNSKSIEYLIPTGCTSLDIKVVPNPTAMDEIDLPEVTVSAHAGRLYIHGIDAEASVKVYDLTGKQLAESEINPSEASLPFAYKGLFVVNIRTADRSITKKASL